MQGPPSEPSDEEDRLDLLENAERRGFERYRAAAAVRAERLLAITSAIADAVTEAEVLEALVDQVSLAIGASSVALWLVDGDARVARLARTAGYPEASAKALEAVPLDVLPSFPTIDAIRRGEALWIASQAALLRDYPHLAPMVTPGRSYRISCLPLVSNGRTLGVLALTIEEAREVTEEERSFLLLVARHASQALERLRLQRENLEARARAEQLYRFAHAAMSSQKIEEVFEAGLDAIGGALGTDRAAILLFDEDRALQLRASRGLSDADRRIVEGHAPWPLRGTTAAPQPVLVPDALGPSAGVGSLAFIPLVTRGQLLGTCVVSYGLGRAYSPSELDLASAIANHLASMVSRFAALAELERTVHYNELFAGVLAHDLRNPLSAMTTSAQHLLMRQQGTGERTVKALTRILVSGHRMDCMIDQLLDFTRARAGGRIGIQPCETNFADLCGQAIGELELVYPDRRIECEIVGDQDGRWDPDRLLQIISNLVGNAGQHAAPGSGISVKLDGRAAEAVTLEVHNEGAIPPGLLPHLFDPFRQARRDHSRGRGLGLGLFIVKELVRAHHGTVEVSSSEERGTTFAVHLPRCPPRP